MRDLRSTKPSGVLIVFVASLLVGAGASSCSSTLSPPSGDVLVDLKHDDPRVRVLAARQAVQIAEEPAQDAGQPDRAEMLQGLLANLEHRDGAVRFFSSIALERLSGQSQGFDAHAPISERELAVQRWRDALGIPAPEPTRVQVAGPSNTQPEPSDGS